MINDSSINEMYDSEPPAVQQQQATSQIVERPKPLKKGDGKKKQ